MSYKRKRSNLCKTCGEPCVKYFCSLKCSERDRWKAKFLPRILAGEITNRPTLRKYLVSIHGHKCQCCNSTEWLGEPIPLELDHIDGNASHNKPENLRVLCPNCHALTPTYKARNKGRGRKSIGL